MLIKIIVDTHGLDKEFSEKARQLPQKISELHTDIAEKVKYTTQKNAPYRTGRLRNSISISENGTTKTVYSDSKLAPYNNIVIDGRSGFKARNKKALKFKINGKWIYRRHVGPSKPNPFFDKAYSQSTRAILNEIEAFEAWLAS